MKKSILPFAIALLTVWGCNNSENNDKKSEEFLPPSSGTHAELLLVTPDSVWQGQIGELLLETFGQEQYGLPQPEGIFSLNKIKPLAFSSLFKRSKSVLLVEIGDTTLVEIQRNVWAKPQIVGTIVAPNKKALRKLILSNAKQLIETFHLADLDVVRGRMHGTAYKTLPKSLADFGIKSMVFSSGFEQTLDKADIKIFRQNTLKTDQFMVFYTRPITPNTLPGHDIIAARDSIGKKYFEGPAAGSYFGTEILMPPQQFNTTIDNQFAIETRGLWKTFGDFRGGPFLSYTIYNENKNEILCIEGFIYGPDAKKRNIMLEMEAMMRSITFKK